jgi:hypothetical protein
MTNLKDTDFDDLANIDDLVIEKIATEIIALLRSNSNKKAPRQGQG